MAKDPAFLFYYDRFLAGTITMSDAQVGQYIRLLCIQANKGYVTEKDILQICKTSDEDINSKFVSVGDGKFINEVLDTVLRERRNFTESRRNNRLGRGKKADASGKEPATEPDTNHPEVLHTTKTLDNQVVNVNVNIDEGIKEDGSMREGAPEKPKKKPRESKPPEVFTFRETKLFDKDYFKAQFKGTDYEFANLDFYYESVLNWSDSRSVDNDKGKKVVRNERGWVATVRNFMLRDKQENKLQLSNEHGINTNNKPGTGNRNYTEGMFD